MNNKFEYSCFFHLQYVDVKVKNQSLRLLLFVT